MAFKEAVKNVMKKGGKKGKGGKPMPIDAVKASGKSGGKKC